MTSHQFVPAPPRKILRRKPRKIFRVVREQGEIVDWPNLGEMTFIQQVNAMKLAGKRTHISTQSFRDLVGQLARRYPQATMGINPKYLRHALDSGSIEELAIEVYGCDPTQPKVFIDDELFMIALDEAFARIADVATNGGNIIFATSRPSSMLPFMIQLASLAHNAGANVLDLFSNTTPGLVDGRAHRRLTWCGGVGVVCGEGSLLSTNDTKIGEDLLFHLSRPDLVVADHVFAGAALTNGYPTVAFTGFESLAVAIASVPEQQCISVPIALSQPSNNYEILANNAKSYFN